MKKEIVIATRGSKLALWQAEYIKSEIEKHHKNITCRLEIIKTMGDKILDVPLAKIGGKGLFVKEIETALLEKRADLAVHSMKDVPMELPAGLELTSCPVAEKPNDAFLSIRYNSIAIRCKSWYFLSPQEITAFRTSPRFRSGRFKR